MNQRYSRKPLPKLPTDFYLSIASVAFVVIGCIVVMYNYEAIESWHVPRRLYFPLALIFIFTPIGIVIFRMIRRINNQDHLNH